MTTSVPGVGKRGLAHRVWKQSWKEARLYQQAYH